MSGDGTGDRSSADFSGFAQLEREGWAEPATAASYAADFARAAAHCAGPIVAAVGAAPSKRIADLCCGHGDLTRALATAGAEVVGLDFSPAMLEIARRDAPALRFVEGNAMATGFEDDSFDAVTIGFGIPHVPDPEQTFREAARILKPGGRFAFTVWHGGGVEGAFGWVFGAIGEHGDPSVQLPPGPDANAYAEEEAAFPALRAAGFTDCARETVDSHWIADDPAAPFRYFLEGTVRGRPLLIGQPPDRSDAIRDAVIAKVRAHCGSSPPYRIPIPAALISATAA